MNLTNDTRNREGVAEVAGVKLRYTISQYTGEQVKNVRADILKNDIRIGTVSVERDGRLYISFDKEGITSVEDQVSIVTQVLQDSAQVFNEQE
ncbi:hypothetical protein [uncultured Parabacteroides sp.]|uniref:hypothetical protein n=1 Tax=uncultured Parabacteroides sp. TaxID=512312 RepID=UPI0025F54DD5|nr:hypothetical protein [uncultured Parabacteroides sp.]